MDAFDTFVQAALEIDCPDTSEEEWRGRFEIWKKMNGSSGSLNALRDEVYENAKAHGFHDVQRTLGDGLMLICTEAAEAFEAYREGAKIAEMGYECKHPKGDCGADRFPRCRPDDGSDGCLHKPVGVPSEIADIIIRCLDFSGEYGIDIERVVSEKMTFNKSRPFRHGNKAL